MFIRKNKIFFWLAIFLWMSVIFYFSNQPNLKSDLPDTLDLIFRKIAHIGEFAVLTYFFIKAFSDFKISHKKVLLFSGIISFLYAGIDEYHQSFVAGRCGNLIDILIDSIGIALIIIFYRK